MWKRSEVERLTGLERHVIQNLCNKNTSQDGLGFWEPAVMKPGYSRFDEGDLLAFYLVRQLVGAGFTQAEVAGMVGDMLEEGDAFAKALQKKALSLCERRRRLDAQLESVRRLGAATACLPENRLYGVMERGLLASADRALDVSGCARGFSAEKRERVKAALRRFAHEIWRAVCGEKNDGQVRALAEGVRSLVSSGVAPSDPEAQRTIRGLVASMADGFAGDDDMIALLVRSLARFLHEEENGVPVELAFGRSSFAYLGDAVSALVVADANGNGLG